MEERYKVSNTFTNTFASGPIFVSLPPMVDFYDIPGLAIEIFNPEHTRGGLLVSQPNYLHISSSKQSSQSQVPSQVRSYSMHSPSEHSKLGASHAGEVV